MDKARRAAEWLPWLEWALVLLAVALWLSGERYATRMAAGGGLLALAWLAHFARTGRFMTPSRLDWPLGAFLLSAVVGVWAAPDLGAALARLNWLVGAAALLYVFLGSRPSAAEAASRGLAALGAALAVYFVTQHPWDTASIKLEWVRGIGQALSALAPDLGLEKPHPNVVASLLAIALPAAAAWGVTAVRAAQRGEHPWWRVAVPVVLGGLTAAGLLLTESRASILAVMAAALLAVWWWGAARVAAWQNWRFGLVFTTPLAAGLTLAAVLAVAQPELLTRALGSVPGPASVVSRLEVFGQSWRLAQDVALTGGGLASFPARYSSYTLIVPSLYLTHAHNLYLQLLVEQGWLGLLSFGAMWAVALWEGARRLAAGTTPRRALTAAGLLGLVVIAVQGLGDATLLASRVAPVLLAPAALALWGETTGAASRVSVMGGRWQWLAGVAAAGVLIAAVLGGKPLAAAWYANMGALRSDRWLLASFPTNAWHSVGDVPALRAAEPALTRALALNPDNRTARFYLGLAAGEHRDFETAAAHMAAALAVDPAHRGVVKSLGYYWTWTGEAERAVELLRGVAEAGAEMEVYAWWWGTQGRADLAERAAQMAARLRAMP